MSEKSYRFLHLLTTHRGGAGRAAWRAHKALRQAGHVSRAMMLEPPPRDDEDVLALLGDPIFKYRRLAQKALVRLVTRQAFIFTDELLSPGLDEDVLAAAVAFKPDAIIVHAISDFLAPSDVLALQEATGANVIWNLMDLAAHTGGCHFAWTCRKYETGCSQCPAVRLPSAVDLAARAWRAKAATFPRIRGVVAVPSSSHATLVRRAQLFAGWRVEVVMYGIAPEEFPIIDTRENREILGINTTAPVLLFGTQEFLERRKGMPLLAEALRRLPQYLPREAPKPYLLVAGKSAGFPSLDSLGYDHRHLGFVDSKTLARAYGAADLFVCPSIEDTGPMMINEAIMAGTPVVAFNIGVVPDLVLPGVTGEIAIQKDATSLAQSLAKVLSWDEKQRRSARSQCRAIAVEKTSAQTLARRFAEIVESFNYEHVVA